MPSRKVSVDLELETAHYVREAEQAAAVTRQVKASLESLDRETDKTSRDMDELAATTALAKRQVDDLGDEARGAAVGVTTLDERIKALRSSVRDLGLQFAANADDDIGRQLESDRRQLARLERIQRSLTPSATKLFDPKNFGGFDFSGFAAESRGFLIAGAVAAGVAMAPVLAGILSAAVVGSIGAGGVVGGAILAARDPRVVTAWKDLGNSLLEQLRPVTDAFALPVINATQTIRDAVVASGIVRTLEDAAALVDPITRSLTGFLVELGPGLDKAVLGSQAVWRMLSRELPEFGESLSDLFESMASVAPEASEAFGDFFDVLEQGTEDFGDLAAGLTEIYALTRSLTQQFKDLTGLDLFGDIIPTFGLIGAIGKLTRGSVTPTLENLEPAARGAASGVSSLASAAKDASKELDKLLTATKKLIPDAFELEDAQDQIADAVQRLNDQIEEQIDNEEDGAGSLDRNTQAGRDNAESVRDLVKQYGDLIVKTAQAGGNTDDLKQQLKDQLVQMGFNRTEVSNYVDQLDKIPVTKLTQLMVENQQALAAIQETDRELRRLSNMSTTIALTPYQLYRAGERASGGDVMAGVPYVINERGFETVTFPASGTVHPANLEPMAGGDVNVTVLLDGQMLEPRMVQVITESQRATRRLVQSNA